MGTDGYGDRTKAWKLLQENFCSIERPALVSLVGQLAKLRLGSERGLNDYFVRLQELMTLLSEAGELITDTLLNALGRNGLPDSYDVLWCKRAFNQPRRFQSGERGSGATLTRGTLDVERVLDMVT